MIVQICASVYECMTLKRGLVMNQELIILNFWVQEFLYNLSDTIK